MPTAIPVDNVGNTIPPGVESGHPKLASGITLTDAETGGNHTQVLTAGKTYKIMTNSVAGWIFGVADVTTAANIIWFCPPSKSVCITMPLTHGTLNYMALVSEATAYVVELA